jgi:DNA-binding MarR family transcriptional regulator
MHQDMMSTRREARISIGIDDAFLRPYSRPVTRGAAEFCELFPAVYLRFHARRKKRDPRLTPQMLAVLQHLAMSGPLTIGEMAQHFERAQSVVSEIVDGLAHKGLLERMRDARDRRRVLVWLTPVAHEQLSRDQRVLDEDLLAQAMSRMRPSDKTALLRGMHALVQAAMAMTAAHEPTTKQRKR